MFLTLCRFDSYFRTADPGNMADQTFEDPSKKRRLDEDGTASAFAENTAESRKEKLETWLKPLDNEQLVKLLQDMCVGSSKTAVQPRSCRSVSCQ